MLKFALFFLAIAVALVPYAEPTPCSICEQATLTNTTETPLTVTFERGTVEGFVVVQPGQTVIVDVVECH